jgi:hypothetical protein
VCAGCTRQPPAIPRDTRSAGILMTRQPSHLQHIPLGHPLLDPAGEDGGGALARQQDRLVGGKQRHPGLLQLVLDLGAVVGAPGDAVDRLADHCVEAAAGPAGLAEQVGDPAIPGDAEVERLVRGALPAGAAGDHPATGTGSMRVAGDGGQHPGLTPPSPRVTSATPTFAGDRKAEVVRRSRAAVVLTGVPSLCRGHATTPSLLRSPTITHGPLTSVRSTRV